MKGQVALIISHTEESCRSMKGGTLYTIQGLLVAPPGEENLKDVMKAAGAADRTAIFVVVDAELSTINDDGEGGVKLSPRA